MKLTLKKLNEVAASVSADHVNSLYEVAKREGSNGGDVARTGFAMMLIGVLTTRRIAEKLGITDDAEVEVTEDAFNDAVTDVIGAESDKEESSFIRVMETTMFAMELSMALFGKEKEDEG